MTNPKFAMLDGKVVAWDDATVHVSSVAFKYGSAVFEGIRAYWNTNEEELFVFQLDEHLLRLGFSQKFMRFSEPIGLDGLREGVLELLRANRFKQNVHITITAFISGGGLMTATGPVSFSAIAAPRPPIDSVAKGCSVQTSAWRRTPDTSAPTRVKCNANYQNGRLASLQAAADGYDTALMLNQAGKVSEGPAMCFFMVRDGVLVTPSRTSDILESITRSTLINLAQEMSIPIEERSVDRSELVAADEAFFCGTAWEVTPIATLDRLPVGRGDVGPVTAALGARLMAIASGSTADYPEWRTAVYGPVEPLLR
jgi:branched-chain amino acid aminotransferase